MWVGVFRRKLSINFKRVLKSKRLNKQTKNPNKNVRKSILNRITFHVMSEKFKKKKYLSMFLKSLNRGTTIGICKHR